MIQKEGITTMIGITSYGAYVPLHRLGPRQRDGVSHSKKRSAIMMKTALTMAVAAALDCLSEQSRRRH